MKTKDILFGAFILFAALLSSCKDEEIVSAQDGKKTGMYFIVNTQEEEVVETRAVGGDMVLSDVYVMLLGGDDSTLDDSRPFVAMALATTTDNNPDANGFRIYFADIDATVPAAKYCVLANVAKVVNSKKASWEASKPTLAEIKADLKIALAMNNGHIIEDPKPAPMVSAVNAYTGIGADYEVTLTRAAAKVTLLDASRNAHYELLGANLGNMATTGTVFNSSASGVAIGNYAGNVSGNNYSLEYMMRGVVAGAKETESLYAFPTPADKAPFILIKGRYNGIVGYHRINLYSDRKNKTFYDIQRNHHYKVTVKTIATTGYATAAEAIVDADGSNEVLNVDITVSDGTSRDIVTNGEYYLGLSNSELVVYSSEDVADVVATTIKYGAPASGSMPTRSISYTTTAGTGTVTYNQDVFGTSSSGELKISMPRTVIKGEFVVRVGELAKKILIERRMDATSFGGAFNLRSDKLVYGKVLGNNKSWIGIAPGSNPDFAGGSDEYFNSGAGKEKLSLVLQNNLLLDASSTNKDRVAELTVTKADDEGHSKILVYQPVFDVFDKAETTEGKIENPYVGAFWRASQTGERVIKMLMRGSDTSRLTWDAVVAIGADWAGLKVGGSADPAIYSGTPNDAESYEILESEMSDYVAGTSENLIFRIGLKGTVGREDHRYGLVVVTTYFDGVPQNHYKIFLRQGDSPDYLFRNGDGGYNNWNGVRDKAVPLSAYNLTDPQLGKGKNGDINGHNVIPLDYYSGNKTFNRAKFTQFPSQAGYFFIWNVAPGQDIKNPKLIQRAPQITKSEGYMRAYHPVSSMGIHALTPLDERDPNLSGGNPFYRDVAKLDYTAQGDPCPYGYRYPSVGEKDNVANWPSTDYAVDKSELMQSLAFHPQINTPSGMSAYTLWGYYADGFFDRLEVNPRSSLAVLEKSMVVKGAGANVSEKLNNATGNDIGYAGMLIFNPYNLSSIFFPATGRIIPFSIVSWGDAFFVWANNRVSYNPSSAGCYPMDWNGMADRFSIISGQGDIGQIRSVRCVRDKNIAVDWKP